MVIKGTSNQIEKELKQPELAYDRLDHLCQRIKGTSAKIIELVNNLRIFSRNPLHDELKPTPIQKILTDTLKLCSEKFRFHSVNILIEPNPMLDIDLNCKETQIAHALLILLTNSFEAIKEKNVKWIKIEVQTEMDNNNLQEYCLIKVSDSGLLISKEIISQIFLPYFTTKKDQHHSGLGLNIARKIASEHDGDLVYLQENHLNTFVLKIPLYKSSTSTDFQDKTHK